MKKTGRLLAILIMAMMIATPFMSFATEEAVVGAPQKEEAVTSEVTTEDADEVKTEETAEAEKTDEEAAPAEETASAEAVETEQTAAPEADPTKVTVAKSIEDLAKKSEATRDNEAFFTIDASKKKTSADLATDEIQQEVKDILKSGESSSKKQTEVAETLQDSGYYSTVETGKTKVDVTSKFAFQRLRLVADKEKEINAYGATKAVYYDGYYLLSYDSMEATKLAYDALTDEYGEKAVLIDIPVSMHATVDWGAQYIGLDREKETIDSLSGDDKNKVKVAVVDTGINPNHEAFDGKTITGGINYVYPGSYPRDDEGHGTAVASVIAQSTPDTVEIMVYKALGSDGKGSFFDIFYAIEDANNKGADIVNLSLGALLDESDPNDLAIKNALQSYDTTIQSMNALVICASGNEHADLDSDYFEIPGEFNSTVCVGAINNSEEKCGFSNYGNAVDFAAPGSGIYLADYSGNTSYKRDSGTSFAAPYVSAVAASLQSVGSVSTKGQLKSELTSMSKDLGASGKDVYFGNGCPRYGTVRDFSNMAALKIIPSNATYTGGALRPSTTVKVYGDVLKENVDYTLSYSSNVYPGRGRVTITGTGNETKGYYGSASAGFNITSHISNAAAYVGMADYTGGATYPGVAVSLAGRPLGGSDYSVSFSNNVHIGTGYATITGRGYYYGSMTVPFQIGPKGTTCKKPARAKKAITVKWARQKSKMPKARITGYQVQVSSDPNFGYNVKTYNVKGYSKTSKKVSKLAKKTTYYARVRTYIKSGGAYYFSNWSNVRAATTK